MKLDSLYWVLIIFYVMFRITFNFLLVDAKRITLILQLLLYAKYYIRHVI